MSATYDDTNIFAKIIRGEIPSTRVYETDDVVAFMDVMPQGTGHTLVVPKAPSRNLLDAKPETLAEAIQTVQKIAQAVKKHSMPMASQSCSSTNQPPARLSIICIFTSSHASKASRSSLILDRWKTRSSFSKR